MAEEDDEEGNCCCGTDRIVEDCLVGDIWNEEEEKGKEKSFIGCPSCHGC